ncbi:hypothetical protein FRB94_002247 [Tulasnella sp. JGI-2019a]|nr:hypothetical protein FRB93_006916 [Tulasnella sp. JGI-2019a]KAG8987046.1 hypothetical protein FRB94_002247 [Tulasnella sp. JGI-2019a]
MNPTEIDQTHPWRGFNKLKYLFVFGDSYSAVGFRPSLKDFEPTEERPIGVEWPGHTWSKNQPVWVNHLINIYAEETLLVYDYAEGGHTVRNVAMQVKDAFLTGAGREDRGNTWKAEDSLFVTWVGINDIAGPIDVDKTLETLFELQDEIHKAGARNFLLFNIPPLPRQMKSSSARPSTFLEQATNRRTLWNDLLSQRLSSFAEMYPGSSTFLFDAHALFTEILDSPTSFGFSTDRDVGTSMDGEVWCDHIHPTTATHKIVAREVFKFLTGNADVLEREPRWTVKQDNVADLNSRLLKAGTAPSATSNVKTSIPSSVFQKAKGLLLRK